MIKKAFLEVLSEGDANGAPFTFPIPTFKVFSSNDRLFDIEGSSVSRQLWELTRKTGAPYFANYTNRPEDSAISMCCFIGSQCVIVKDRYGKIRKQTLRHLAERGEEVEVFFNGQWVRARPVKVPYDDEFITIRLRNGVEIHVTKDHIHRTIDGLKTTTELKIGDKLTLNKYPMRDGNLGTYELGYFIGTYVAEGCMLVSGGKITIRFTFGAHELNSIERIKSFIESLGYKATVHKQKNCEAIDVDVTSKTLVSLIRDYVKGQRATEKALTPKWLTMSEEFRRGLWDGWLEHDGTRRKEAYTSSKQLALDMMEVAVSIGEYVNYRSLTTNKNNYLNRERILHTIHVCMLGKKIYTDADDDYVYVPITDIEVTDSRHMHDGYAYCLEVDTDEHLFSLPNGLVTHNCRLNIDLDEVRGTGLWNIGSSTGSLAINTINLNAIACKARRDNIDFFDLLRDVCDLTAKMLLKRKDYILYGYEHGLLPYTRGYINTLETFFLTIGLVGAADAYVNYCHEGIDDIKEFTDFCVKVLNTVNERVEDYKANSGWKLWNVEQSPAEGAAHSLARRDRRIYHCYTGGITGNEYLTNSTHLPVDTQLTLEHLNHRSRTDNLYSGGTLLNFYTSEVMDKVRVMFLVKRLMVKNQLPYVAYTPTFKVCPVHGYAGIGIERCKDCGRELVNYTRVVGYIRPTTRFNPGQLRQFMDRRYSSA
ncbi:MAG: hypothetical protein DRJ03_30600 [Chloroflexi bacterium]|nr:MAG: hypothetical protein DRJ03_30600 [Chloroflexota bacterium]